MPEQRVFTIPEFCTVYRTSRSNTFVLLRDGRLKGIKIGKMTRIRVEDAEAWAAALPPAGRANPAPELKQLLKPVPPQDPPEQAALPLRPVARPKRKPKPRRQKRRRTQGRLGQAAAE